MRELWRKVVLLVIDECSMVSTEMLQTIDAHLKLFRNNDRAPFGGVCVIMVGDLYQLPPVNGKALFHAQLHWPLLQLVDLEGNFRAAEDPTFAALLSRLRVANLTDEDESTLRRRAQSEPTAERSNAAMHLFPRRADVARHNADCVTRLASPDDEVPIVAVDQYNIPRVGPTADPEDVPDDDR
eukprot:6127896-Amphidinium_carterae.1